MDTEAATQWAIKAIQRNNAFTIEPDAHHGAAWGLPFRKALQRQLKEQGAIPGRSMANSVPRRKRRSIRWRTGTSRG
jgi:hypothetical protein